MGTSAWARSEGALPSQTNEVFHARLRSGMEWRRPVFPSVPVLGFRGSLRVLPWWQELQEMLLFLESWVSCKSFSPRATRDSLRRSRSTARVMVPRFGSLAAFSAVPG